MLLPHFFLLLLLLLRLLLHVPIVIASRIHLILANTQMYIYMCKNLVCSPMRNVRYFLLSLCFYRSAAAVTAAVRKQPAKCFDATTLKVSFFFFFGRLGNTWKIFRSLHSGQRVCLGLERSVIGVFCRFSGALMWQDIIGPSKLVHPIKWVKNVLSRSRWDRLTTRE